MKTTVKLFIVSAFLFLVWSAGHAFVREDANYTRWDIDRRAAELRSPVSSKYSPAVIYALREGKRVFRGSGTLLSDGKTLVTAGHVFSKRNDKFIVERVRDATREEGVAAVRGMGPWNQAPFWDVAIAKVGEPAYIKGAYDTRGEVKNLPLVWFRDGKTRLTSLVDGKAYTVLTVGLITNGCGESICTIPYAALNGESGTGFVDDKGNLYVLIQGGPVTHRNAKVLGAEEAKEMTWLFGPVNV